MPAVAAKAIMIRVWDTLSDMFRELTMWLLMLDTVPEHVCIIPDGHRRFARATGTDLRQAYRIGKDNVFRVSGWYFSSRAAVLSVFPFSLHNLARTSFEMTAILDKAKDACEYIMNNLSELRKLGLRVETNGDLELLPHDVGAAMALMEIATSSHTQKCFKICMAYSTKHQTAHMVLRLAKAVKEGVIRVDHKLRTSRGHSFLPDLRRDITTHFSEDCVKLFECCDVELLVRTSGIQRFSDCLALQSGYACFRKEHVKFPEFGFRHWVAAILQFQVRWPQIQAVKQRHGRLVDKSVSRLNVEQTTRQQTLLRRLQAARTPYLERLATVKEPALQD